MLWLAINLLLIYEMSGDCQEALHPDTTDKELQTSYNSCDLDTTKEWMMKGEDICDYKERDRHMNSCGDLR